ncbi:MAG: sugar transferase, partial [Flavobacterium sp.]
MQFEKLDDSAKVISQSKIDIICCADAYRDDISSTFSGADYHIKFVEDIKLLQQLAQNLSINQLNTCILVEVNLENQVAAEELVTILKSNWLTRNLVIIFLVAEDVPTISKSALQLGVSDCYLQPIPFEDVKERLNFLSFYKLLRSQVTNLSEVYNKEYRYPLGKRFLDVFLSAVALICISPLMLIVGILIKLDSKGPVFYVSKRVGTGYKIFDFYKFRSMRTGADEEVKKLVKENQYGDSAFFKLKNDPRVTKLGNFLRNTSIDELPQLLNVIKGDMSLVGN